MKIKKLLAIILSVIMVVTIIPTFTALGESIFEEEYYDEFESYFQIGDFVFVNKFEEYDLTYGDRTDDIDFDEYRYDSDEANWETLWVTGYTGESSHVVIPESVDGRKITRIENFKYFGESNVELQEITFSSSITINGFVKDIQKINLAENSTVKIMKANTDALYVPDSTRITDDSCLSHVKNITITKNNKYHTFKNGVLFNKKMTKLIAFSAVNTDKRYTVPTGVTTICESSFEENKTLASVTIPKTVTQIYKWAFSSTDIVNLNCYGNLKFVGKYCFQNSNDLESVVFHGVVKTVNKKAFYYCSNLNTVKFKKGNLKSIASRAFSQCKKLKNFTISNTKNMPSITSSIFSYVPKTQIKFYVKNNTFAKKLKARLKKSVLKARKFI